MGKSRKIILRILMVPLLMLWVLYIIPAPQASAWIYHLAGAPDPQQWGSEGAFSSWTSQASRWSDLAVDFGLSRALGDRAMQRGKKGQSELSKAAAQNEPRALNNLGVILYQRGEHAKAMELWEQSQLPEARVNMGIASYLGKGTQQDKGRARELMESALPHEDATYNLTAFGMREPSPAEPGYAQLVVNRTFNQGREMEEKGEHDKAKQLYTKALEGGSLEAGYNLYRLQPDPLLLAKLFVLRDPKAVAQVNRLLTIKAVQGVTMARLGALSEQHRTAKAKLNELNYLYMRAKSDREREELKASMPKVREIIKAIEAGHQAIKEKLPYASPETAKEQDMLLVALADHLPGRTQQQIVNLFQVSQQKNPEVASEQLRATLSSIKEDQKGIPLVSELSYPVQTFERLSRISNTPATSPSAWLWHLMRIKENIHLAMLIPLTLVLGLASYLPTRPVKAPKATDQPAWEKLADTAKREAQEQAYLDALGIIEAQSLRQVRSAYHKQCRQYGRKAQRRMSVEELEQSKEKMEHLQKALNHFQTKLYRTQEFSPKPPTRKS